MGFLTRLLAGLVAASTLGAGLAGTAGAVDTTGTAGDAKGVVKLTADDTNNLPDHIVNGGFDYPSVPSWTGLTGSSSNKFNKGKLFATINPGTGKYGSGCAMSTTGRPLPNWNRSSFAWNSTQGDTHYSGGMSCEAGNVELNYDSVHHNQFGELTADQQGTAIYQDVKVTPGTMMKWSLKHSSATSAYVDKMQVMIGEPYKETVQEATRIASENGNKVGEKMTTISTPTTSDRADNKKWDTYSGTYLVPDGVTTVRFTFKSVASAEWYSGNDLDDIEFSRSYKLSYDKNASNATGSVPSNQRGKENTVQPAASKTNGTVKTVADDTSNLSDHLVNGDFEYPGANVLSKNRYDEKDANWWGVSRKDKMVYDPSHETQWVSLPSTFDSDRFAWKSIDAKAYNLGNLLDDIVFDKAYRLSYDKNATDANGSVPSDETAGATKQAKASTTGTLRLASDDGVAAYAASNLPKQLVNSDFDHDWRNIVGQSRMSEKYNFANIDPAHGDVEISGALNGKGEASKQWVHLNGFDANKFGWKSNQTDTRVDGRGGIVEIQRSKANDNMYAEITASQANTYLYQDIDTAHSTPTVYTVKLRYAHRNGSINSNERIQILVGAPGHEQPVEMTRIASDRGNRLGEKSTTVNAPNTDGWLGSWDTFQGSVVVPAGQNVSRFTFKALGSTDGVSGNLIDDVQFKLAYKLSYDKNAQDATGSVPSSQYGKENTVQPAKAKTTGSVRLAADKTASGLTVHDLEMNDIPADTTPDTTQTASSKSTGKVSDLVQRTTTHEDGSVTVRTIDTSTDVVSGCQVYYPAGQKITLATMAKDDDCWDSSMLSRPGHTQLGWNQDRNATQAQAQVTMVEGGMTVYAVWVGNPVLTYDTNKPSTWTGQMPSTPASVSVPYNTAAADGSGWQAGDTTKIRGYRFLGWYTGPQDNAGLYDWTRPLTGSVTVYAHWQRLQANVIYNANGGTGSHPNTTGWQYSDATIPGDTSKSFKHDGLYRFKHWNTQPNDQGTVYTDGSRIALQDKDITLYAIWVPYHENFVPTGGIGLPIAIAGGVLLLMFGIGSTVMLTRRMNGHGMPDDE